MILYPTETVYGLGVNALDIDELQKLYDLKSRNVEKQINWLVRDIEDVRQYAKLGELAEKIVTKFLPGPLTIVLPLEKDVLEMYPFLNSTIGFRISSDPIAQKVISDFMGEYDSPLTSTSANISGYSTQATVPKILKQFESKRKMIDTIIDEGSREGVSSTVVELKKEQLIVHREGQIPSNDIQDAV